MTSQIKVAISEELVILKNHFSRYIPLKTLQNYFTTLPELVGDKSILLNNISN